MSWLVLEWNRAQACSRNISQVASSTLRPRAFARNLSSQDGDWLDQLLFDFLWRSDALAPWRHIAKPDQIDIVAFAVFCNFEQIQNSQES